MDLNFPIDGKEAILIAGPTASGKSGLAMVLARAHDGEIVNADSMQVYSVLRVLTARPDQADLAAVPHHLYGHVSPDAAYSTGHWLDDAHAAIADIKGRGKLPIIVGGTGLYFRALLGGLSEMPVVAPERRTFWRERLAEEGAQALHVELQRRDALMAERLSPGDGQRILRALEIHDQTGRSIAEFQRPTGKAAFASENTAKIVLMPDRNRLAERIERRFHQMVAENALEEVRSLLALKLDPRQPAMKAIGVPEFASHLRGEIAFQDAVNASIIHTRQYAKRQKTWMRNQLDPSWSLYEGEI